MGVIDDYFKKKKEEEERQLALSRQPVVQSRNPIFATGGYDEKGMKEVSRPSTPQLAVGGYNESGMKSTSVFQPSAQKASNNTVDTYFQEKIVREKSDRNADALKWTKDERKELRKDYISGSTGLGFWGSVGGTIKGINALLGEIGKNSEVMRDLDKISENLYERQQRGAEYVKPKKITTMLLEGSGQMAATLPLLLTSSPAYLTGNAVSIFGNSFQDAKSSGAGYWKSMSYALTNAAAQTIIESTGGMGAVGKFVGKGGKGYISSLLDSAWDEAREEGLGYLTQAATDKAFLGRDTDLSAKDAAQQMAVGGIFGGAFGASNIQSLYNTQAPETQAPTTQTKGNPIFDAIAGGVLKGKIKYTKDPLEARQQIIDTLVESGVPEQEAVATANDMVAQQAEPVSEAMNNVADDAVKQDANGQLVALKSKYRADVVKAKKIKDPDERDMALTELKYIYDANVHAINNALDTEAAQVATQNAVDSAIAADATQTTVDSAIATEATQAAIGNTIANEPQPIETVDQLYNYVYGEEAPAKEAPGVQDTSAVAQNEPKTVSNTLMRLNIPEIDIASYPQDIQKRIYTLRKQLADAVKFAEKRTHGKERDAMIANAIKTFNSDMATAITAYDKKQTNKTRRQRANEARIVEVGNKLGRKVVFLGQEDFVKATGKIANGAWMDGTIYMNRDGSGSLPRVFTHELTHSIEEANMYEQFKAAIFNSRILQDELAKKNITLEDLRKAKANEYARQGVVLKNQADIDAEIIANFTAKHLFANMDAIQELANTSPSLARVILDKIESILNKLGVNVQLGEKQFLEQARSMYRLALDEKSASSNPSFTFADENALFADNDIASPVVPSFYSKLIQTVEKAKQDKFSTQGLTSYLIGRGVKPDEIKWLGLEQFIEGKKSVSKAELLEHLRANDLRIEENAHDKSELDFRKTGLNTSVYLRRRDDVRVIELVVDGDIIGEMTERPDGTWIETASGRVFADRDDAMASMREWEWAIAHDATEEPIARRFPTKYNAFAIDGGSNYREMLFIWPDAERTWRHPHWLEENVIAHTRLQDFLDADKNLVLFVEEVQSDWHQAGQKKGYRDVRLFREENKAREAALDWLRKNYPSDWLRKKSPRLLDSDEEHVLSQLMFHSDHEEFRNEHPDFFELTSKYAQVYFDHELQPGKIADAPFKDTWQEYVLKRIIRMAAEGDYDKVAWTTGDMQSDRYDLRHHISGVSICRIKKDIYTYNVNDLDGRSINRLNKWEATKKEVMDVFGDRLGSRLIDGADQTPGKIYDIGGFDLAIGGEGMVDFYDVGGKSSKNLPRFLDKYVKQWGSSVGMTELSTGDIVPSIEITDAMRDSVLHEGQPRFAIDDTSWDSDLDSVNPATPTGSGPEHINQAAINTVPKAAESGLISEENAADVASSPDLITNTITHEDDIRTADAFIEQKGGLEAASEWASGRLNDQAPFNISEMAVLRELIRRNNQMGTSLGNDRAVRFMESAMKQFSDAGRLLEFAKAFVQDNPAQFVTMAKKAAPEAVNEQMEADLLSLGNLAASGKLRRSDVDNMSDDLALWLVKAQAYLGDQSLNDAATAKALVYINDLKPKDHRRQFRALQRISMLSNPKTHVRNIMGNAVLGATETMAHPIASIFDRVLSGMTGQRTFGSGGAAAGIAGGVEGIQNAVIDQALGLNLVASKYGENPAGFAKAFVDKGLGKYINKIDNAIGFLLKLGDEPFRNGQYESVLAQLANANPEAVAANGGKPTAEMIDTAIESAYRRTFQDNNKITKAFQDVREALPYIGETIAPFVKTPANVIKVAMEYSPIGVVEAIAKTYWGKNSIKKLRARDESTMSLQRDTAELFGRGFVGSGLMLLGGILAGAGLAIGDDDEMSAKEQGWASATGRNPGMVKIGNDYVDLSSMQTFAAPLMAGASAKDGDWAGILQSAANVGNTALEMPVLQGVQELFNGNDDSLPEIVANILASSMTQVIPLGSALRQVATLIDPYSRTTQPDASGVGGMLERGWNKVKNTLPGVRETLPQVYDTLGNPVVSYEADSGIGRAANILLNPFTTDKEYKSEVTDEIDRLYQETFNTDVLPGKIVDRNLSNDNVQYKLTRSEMQEFQKTQGEASRLMLEELVQSQAYKDASLEEQVDMVAKAMDYGRETAKSDYLATRGVEYKKTGVAPRFDVLAEKGIPEHAVLYAYVQDGTNAKDDAGEPIQNSGSANVAKKIASAGFDKDTALALAEEFCNKGVTAALGVAYEIEADPTAILDAYVGMSNLDKEGAFSKVQMQAKYIAGLDTLTPEQKKAFSDALLVKETYFTEETDIDYSDGDSAIISTMSATAQEAWPSMKDRGMDVETFVEAYKISATSKTGYKKADKIRDLMQVFGWSYAQALNFYRATN